MQQIRPLDRIAKKAGFEIFDNDFAYPACLSPETFHRIVPWLSQDFYFS